MGYEERKGHMVRGAKLWEWAMGTKKIIVIERDKGELP